MVFMLCVGILLFIFRKKGLKAPGGRDFKNIRLKLISGRKLYRIFDFEHLVRGMLIIGGAGAGKTKSIVEPLVARIAKEQYTGLIYDFKFPTLANHYYDKWLDISSPKVNPYYINFDDLSKTSRFNVLKIVPNSTYAQEYSASLMMNLIPESIKNPDFFSRTASSLVSSSIWYFHRNKKEFCTLPHIITFLLNSDLKRIIDILSSDEQTADIVAPVRSGLSSEKQTAGVISSLQNALNYCATPNVFWVLSGDDFDLVLNDPLEPKIVILGNKASLQQSISPVISMIITVSSKLMNEKGRDKSIILLEEGPTLYIPNFETIPATGRENKIATVYCGQDIAQMEDKFSEKKAEILISNLASQLYGKISNPRTMEKVVKVFDKDEVVFESQSSNHSSRSWNESSSGRSHSLQQRDRVTISHLRDLNPGEFVATTVGQKDFKAIFLQTPKNEFDLPAINYVTERMVHDNYQKIKQDVLSLFN
jgi:hypothetical protein